MTDALPRLILAREAGVTEPVVLPEFVARAGHTTAVLDLLQEATEVLSVRRRYSFEKLAIVSPVAPTGSPDPAVLHKLRRRLVQAIGSQESQRNGSSRQPSEGLRLWVSRRLSSRRKLENEEEVLRMVESHGFLAVFPELLSVKEQLHLFSRASLAVGLHGAGLTNILMMSPGANVIEVRRHGDSHNNSYFALASACDLNYFYVSARCRHLMAGLKGWRVDVGELEAIVEEIS